MRKILAIAALLLASTTAQAQYTFEYGGRTIRVDPDRGTVSIPGVYDNTGRKAKRSRNENGDRDRSRKQSPQQAKTDSQATPDVAAPAAAPAARAGGCAARSRCSRAGYRFDPRNIDHDGCRCSDGYRDHTSACASGSARCRAGSHPVAAAPPVQAVPPPAPAAVQAANSPLGVWLTEEKEGKVRIEQCGANLCGYSVDRTSNQNGEQVLINMKPGKDSKWSGRILDPNTGSTYDSTIALKGNDSLRVQGCAFSGVFCGGQTWTRVN